MMALLLWPMVATAAPTQVPKVERYRLTEADYAKDGHLFWFVRDFLTTQLIGQLTPNQFEPDPGLELWAGPSFSHCVVHVAEFDEHDRVVAGYDMGFRLVDGGMMRYAASTRKIKRMPAILTIEGQGLEHTYLIVKIPGMDDPETWKKYQWSLLSKYMLVYIGSSGINRMERIYK